MQKYLEKLCDFIADNDYGRMHEWQWGQGVCLFALEKAYEKTGNEKYMDFIEKWIYSHLEEKTPGFSVNTTSALNGILALYEKRKDDKYMYLCEEFANYILSECPRCDKGALEHTCVGNTYPNQICVDTVFMGGIFLVRYGLITGKRMYVNEALRQLVLHFDFLHSIENDLLYHGYYCDDRTLHGALWGRGNAWYSAACGVILEMVDDSYPLKKEVEKRFMRHLNAVLSNQREDGTWGTIITDSSSYSETTGTSGMAFGITKAIEMGYIGADYKINAEKAYKYLISNIADNGAMTEGSDGTSVRDEMEIYKNTRKSDSEFSQGLAILAFTV